MQNIRATLALAGLASVITSWAAGAQGAPIPGALEPTDRNPLTRQGTRGAEFLHLFVGARGAAMAGAVVSTVEGPTAMYWNPAGLATTEGFSIAASRENLYQGLDISHDFAGAALPVLGGVVGVHFNSLSSGDIPRTSIGQAPLDPDPIFGRNFTWTSTSIGVSYGRRLTDRLELGATGKYITEGITDASISWVGLDLGTVFNTGIYGLQVGASVQNIGPSSKMKGAAIRRLVDTDQFSLERTAVDLTTRETELPTLFRFSIGTDVLGRTGSLFGDGGGKHALRGEMAVNDAINTDIQLAFGGEYSFNNVAFLRAGKRFYNDERAIGGTKGMYGLSSGAGVRLPFRGRAVRFDYAYTSLGELKNVQVFTFEFGK
ncbi:MAG TPA: PorV/PorQ family protein [Gemmatimonadaceae bacterium]|nr:PorV/PorQ family protein [Gemmatimonadaceae bacterium]